LYRTQVSDVSALKDLKNLKELYLSEEQQENLKTQIQQLKKALPELQIRKWQF
jgi:Leucine-rich repeat (LRR) protein